MHLFSTLELGSVDIRSGREDAGLEARHRLAQEAGLEWDQVAYIGAVHGAQVARTEAPGLIEGMDGLITERRGLGLFATYGDCFPIVVFDPDRPAVGLAHAGWRGTAAGIAKELVKAMAAQYGTRPERIWAGLGPGVCGSCYDVDSDVAERFPNAVLAAGDAPGRWRLDVGLANRLQLREAGVPADQISQSEWCTKETAWLPSHRRDHDGRRFGALVALP